jgi:hypothetical protein
MDHEATREQLELAAAEPGGLERLMAGDTPAAQAVAAHLAGCSACTGELARLERAARVIGQVVREQPPADLRERTLAIIRTAGVRRGAAAEEPAVAPFPRPMSAGQGLTISTRGRSALGWVAAIAAAVVVSVIATSFIVGGRVDDRLAISPMRSAGAVTIRDLECRRPTPGGSPGDRRRRTGCGRSPRVLAVDLELVVATGRRRRLGQEYR